MYVCTATEFFGLADGEYAHFVAVFFAKQHHRAAVFGVVNGHELRAGGTVTEDLLVNPLFDLGDFVRGYGGVMREVKTGFVCIDQ